MEDAAGVGPALGSPSWCAVWALLVAVGLPIAIGAGTEVSVASEVAEALGRLGPPGFLWGRLAVEEESPDGSWTPLNGVEVHVYPAVPSLLAELERIRQSARDSRAQHETAVARLQAALRAYQKQVEAASQGIVPPGEVDAPGEQGRRRVTDPAGLFAFEDLPSGEWLLVAVRVTPYGPATLRAEPRRGVSPREQRFVPGSKPAPKDAEVWLRRVRVGPDERVSLFLTDRARWFVGPLR